MNAQEKRELADLRAEVAHLRDDNDWLRAAHCSTCLKFIIHGIKANCCSHERAYGEGRPENEG